MKSGKVCNVCGRVLDEAQEDYLVIEKEWGYFSNKDGTYDRIRVCEICYDQWVEQFAQPVDRQQVAELV